jgi:DNA phosphorothioation-associated putative methyltransferase
MIEVERHRAAMVRVGMSRPIRLLLESGLAAPGDEIFDYGCGRGADIEALREAGLNVRGWDPYYAPEFSKEPAAIVNIGYVINVIENPNERAQVLMEAWALAKRMLVVSARLVSESSGLAGEQFADGVITRRGTFQKFYEQAELRDYIAQTTGVMPVSAAPGVFFVFRDESAKQAFLVTRYRRVNLGPKVRLREDLYEKYKELFEPIVEFFETKGRMPNADEVPTLDLVAAKIGSVSRVARALEKVLGAERLEAARKAVRNDLLVYLALSKFERRPPLRQLPTGLQLDIRSAFSSYKDACEEADALLFSVGNLQNVDKACRTSPIGKITPEALYVHISALGDLSPTLRVYEGCARVLVGSFEHANIIKLARTEPKVSYLSYPDFDNDPHPAIRESLRVHLQSFNLKYRTFHDAANPPILHRKETFVTSYYALRAKFERLTRQEERFGLYEESRRIGTRRGWEEALTAKGVALKGHRVVKLKCPQPSGGEALFDCVDSV